jgi:hypothetical protein
MTYNLCSNGHNQPNLITLQVLLFCTYTLAGVALPLLNASWAFSFGMTETYHCILEFLLLIQNDDFWAESSVLGKHICCMAWDLETVVGGGNYRVSQKLLHCEGTVTRCMAMMQNPFISPFFQPSLIPWFLWVICFYPQWCWNSAQVCKAAYKFFFFVVVVDCSWCCWVQWHLSVKVQRICRNKEWWWKIYCIICTAHF